MCVLVFVRDLYTFICTYIKNISKQYIFICTYIACVLVTRAGLYHFL